MTDTEWIEGVRAWILANGIAFLVNLFVFLLILLAGKIAIGATCRIVGRALGRSSRINDVLADFTLNVLHKVLWGFVIIIGLGQIGINVTPLIAGLGIAGFILGFAFQESLGNLAAGLMVLLNQPFKTGDYVEAGGESGSVVDLSLMATTLITPDNKRVTIPNRTIWSSSITNYSALDTRRVDLTVGISYGSPIGKARDLLAGLLRSDERVLEDPEPVIEVIALADSSVNLVVRPWCKTADYWALLFHLNRAIKETFDREGIEIPFPQLDVYHHGLPGPHNGDQSSGSHENGEPSFESKEKES